MPSDSPIPDNEWVTMPQYEGMQYMYSPPTAWQNTDDGRLKLRLGDYRAARLIPEDILLQGDLAETVWAYCKAFYQGYKYDLTQGRRSSY